MFGKRFSRALVVVTTASLLMASAAFADDISNNLDATVDTPLESMPLTAGGTAGSTTLRVIPVNGDGRNNCNFDVTGGTLVTAASTSDASVATVSPASISWTSCTQTQLLTVTPVGAGSAAITLTETSNTTRKSSPPGTTIPAEFDLRPASFTVNVTAPAKANQTITFNQPASPQPYGSFFNVNPTATSGLPVAVAAFGGCFAVAAASGHDVTMTSASVSCELTATQGGNASYNAASQVVRTVAATKAAQATLSVTAPTAGTYGQFYAMTASGGSGGGAVSFDVVAGSTGCAIVSGGDNDGMLEITNGSGTCSITASKAGDANYESTSSAAATVAVSKASQTINFTQPGSPATFGSTFNVNPTADSGLPVSLLATGGCAATTLTPPLVGWDIEMTSGTTACVLTASQAGDDNYDAATDVERTVVAAKAAQEITFTSTAPSPLNVGDTYVPAATASSALPVSIGASGACSWNSSTGLVTMTSIGTCTVTANQAGSDDYLAAAQAAQTISVRYVFIGFFRPIDPAPTFNMLKAGQAVPIKFSIGGDFGLDILGSATQRAVVCDPHLVTSDDTAIVTAGNSSLQYDPISQQYTYVWKTDKNMAGSCRSLTITLTDGTTQTALFKLNK